MSPMTGGLIPGSVSVINILSDECLGRAIGAFDDGFASAVWTTNYCVYVPLLLQSPMTCTYMFWENGSAVSGNTEVAIYNLAGTTEIVGTGSTANSGTSTIQVVNVTDTPIPAGEWLWMCLGCDNSTQAFNRANPSVQILDALGVKGATEFSSGIPSTLSLSTPTVANLPIFGFSSQSVM